jgi:hypothetical protein
VNTTHKKEPPVIWEAQACPGSRVFIKTDKRKKERCPECGRRLLTCFDDGGGENQYFLPVHKPKG